MSIDNEEIGGVDVDGVDDAADGVCCVDVGEDDYGGECIGSDGGVDVNWGDVPLLIVAGVLCMCACDDDGRVYTAVVVGTYRMTVYLLCVVIVVVLPLWSVLL